MPRDLPPTPERPEDLIRRLVREYREQHPNGAPRGTFRAAYEFFNSPIAPDDDWSDAHHERPWRG